MISLPDVLRVVTPATSYLGSPVPRGRFAGRGEGVRDLGKEVARCNVDSLVASGPAQLPKALRKPGMLLTFAVGIRYNR